MPSRYLPTLYKARRVPTKQAVCAICVERTRGKTRLVELGYGVSVHLCIEHASHEFQTQRGGRDFVLTLQRLWHAHGCLTIARSSALRRHLTACSGAQARPRPGSYSWPALRVEAEAAFAAGRPARTVIATLRSLHADGPATPPSLRTMRRWCTERRWLARATGPAP
jgi:hypothetical protein